MQINSNPLKQNVSFVYAAMHLTAIKTRTQTLETQNVRESKYIVRNRNVIMAQMYIIKKKRKCGWKLYL